jgi:hypothetical protein
VSQVRTALFLFRPAYEGCGFGSDRFTAVRFCETVGSLIGYLLELSLLFWKRGTFNWLNVLGTLNLYKFWSIE